MKKPAILMLASAALWICGILCLTLLHPVHDGKLAQFIYLCFGSALVTSVVGAVLFTYRLIKFFITRNSQELK